MFEEVLDYVKQLEEIRSNTREFLYAIRGGRRRLVNKIIKSEEAVKSLKNETKYVASLKPALKIASIQAAKDILFGQALEAIRVNYEFDHPLYRKALFTSIEDDDTYLVRFRGSGFNLIIHVDINLDKTAGRLDLWGSAVKATRKQLEVNVPKKNSKVSQKSAQQASRAWAGIFENREAGKSTFTKTVRLRLGNSGRPAPFWQLLDKGDVSLSSDRGGYPTPRKDRTNFVHESQVAVDTYVREFLVDERAKYEQLFLDYNKFLEEAQISLEEVDAIIHEIRLERERINSLKKRFGPTAKYIDSNKLEKAVQLIQKGLLTKGRIDLTAKASKRRVRASVSTIKELLY